MTVAAIMQPTYLPWAGYLAMIEKADIFVFLDSVQFARRSWQQRNRIKTPAGEQMLTIPVLNKGRRDQKISEVQIDCTSRFADKHKATISANYAGAAYFDDYAPQLFSCLDNAGPSLSVFTIEIVEWLMKCIECTTPILRSSDLQAEGQKDELLFAICRELDADVYLAAPASRDYLDQSECFSGSGVEIVYHAYNHPTYPQCHGAFLPYMSSLDMLLNTGEECREILMSGVAA